jgi:hypothetical protein
VACQKVPVLTGLEKSLLAPNTKVGLKRLVEASKDAGVVFAGTRPSNWMGQSCPRVAVAKARNESSLAGIAQNLIMSVYSEDINNEEKDIETDN